MIVPSPLVLSLSGMGPVDLLLRASNEGLLRPRVARAEEISRLLPVPIVRVLRARTMVGGSLSHVGEI